MLNPKQLLQSELLSQSDQPHQDLGHLKQNGLLEIVGANLNGKCSEGQLLVLAEC